MATTIETLAVAVTANVSKFEKGFKRARRKFRRFTRSVKRNAAIVSAAATAAAVGIERMVNRVTAAGDKVAKDAKRIGTSAETLSKLGFAAERSGASMGDIVKGLRVFARYADEANQGTGEYLELFERLGITVSDAAGELRPMQELFIETADAIAQMSNAGEQTALAQQLFGRGGTALLPMLKEGKAGIEALTAEAERLGAVWTSEQAAMAEAYQDAMTDFKTATAGAFRQIVMRIAPDLQKVIQGLTQYIVEHGDAIADKVLKAYQDLKGVVSDMAPFFQMIADAALVAGQAIVTMAAAILEAKRRILDFKEEGVRQAAGAQAEVLSAEADIWMDVAKRGEAAVAELVRREKERGSFYVVTDQVEAEEDVLSQIRSNREFRRKRGREFDVRALAERNAGVRNRQAGLERADAAAPEPLKNLNRQLDKLAKNVDKLRNREEKRARTGVAPTGTFGNQRALGEAGTLGSGEAKRVFGGIGLRLGEVFGQIGSKAAEQAMRRDAGGALQRGTSGAFSSILQAMRGRPSGPEKVAKDTLQENKRQNLKLDRIEDAIRDSGQQMAIVQLAGA